MYGIVNQAIQGLVTEQFGEETWQKVKEKSKVNIDTFFNNESYEDKVTYDLAGAAADVLGIPLSEVLIAFGEYWVLKTGMKNYGSLMKSGGGNLKEFLINLPNFHSRVMLIYPNLTPPEFRVSNVDENSLQLHYYSQREGLADFVVGLLQGLGKMFETAITIDLIKSRSEGFDHEICSVHW
ncbi:MAG: heme NO-binding domain-containing protein [Flavobacteriales bacterium]|nr:heme NO-binding domain-containing protein [Flavobacteriales bacterium]